MFQDVHAGGVAAQAGIAPGDVLLTVELIPPDAATFTLGRTYVVTIRRLDGSTARFTLEVPGSREKKRPLAIPDQVVTVLKLGHGIGVIRVSMIPGILGMHVARDISRAISDLDLRETGHRPERQHGRRYWLLAPDESIVHRESRCRLQPRAVTYSEGLCQRAVAAV
jgi:hypothetical protein